MKHLITLIMIMVCLIGLCGCQTAKVQTWQVEYDGNGNTGGSPPMDTTPYPNGRTIVLMGNPGWLVKQGYGFSGWNLKPDGSGVNYVAGSRVTMGTGNLVFYATWTKLLVTMVPVPGGSFSMGDASDAESAHPVSLSSFLISKHEVTQEQYRIVTGAIPSQFGGPNRPVEMVTWYDAVEFCNKLSVREGLQPVYAIAGRSPTTGYPITAASVTVDMSRSGYRLPTEAEWEYAAKGGSGSPGNFRYAGSEDVDSVAWYTSNSLYVTHTVGTKAANGLGVFDMSGNVWEWCQDWYGDYPSDAQTDPMGVSSGTERVWRGGAWITRAEYCRSASRGNGIPGDRSFIVGFRIARRQ